MAVRIYIEIGHEASIRTKKTQEGFTHDWEVFVRGCDGAEIHYYIDKVVFYLHETFPKPKRVIKEPPYVVKESGYAGFNLPIDIYLRNNGEPKKIRFNYDLHLQQSGPPIIKVQKEKYVFNNVSDEFRTKLLKGGGMIVNSSNVTENLDNRSNFDDKQQMINKPKLAINSSDIIKKPKLKISDSYNNDNFQELFGSPILTTSKTVDTKPQPSWKDTKSLSKSDKEKWRTKHSPHKDSHKDRDKDRDKLKDKIDSDRKSNRDDKKIKEKLKERERGSKDKERNLKKEQRTPSPKRSPARLTSPLIIKHKDSGGGGSSSNNNSNNKHDKDNKRGDKSNDDRKLKKDKRNKDHKENKQIIDDSSSNNNNIRLDEQRDKIKLEKDLKKESIKVVKNENSPSPQLQKPPKKEKTKEKKDKDQSKEKYKSKKKDKERKDDKEKRSYSKNDKKSDLKQKTETIVQTPAQQQQQAPPLPLTPNKTTIKKEKSNFLIDEDSSSSSSSSTTSLATTTTTTATAAEKKSRHENNKNKDEKSFKTNKKDRNSQDSQGKYNKRKSNSPEREEPPEKQQRDSNINNNSDEHKEIERNFKTTINQEEEDYLNLLRELQHKIMGLKDNNDLTKVVQLIAETGRYEVSAHTFDFDLCLLDRSTVQQLQNFFANDY